MPSFDIVSEINLQELDNAINNLKKQLLSRFDFKGSNTIVDLNKKDKTIKITSTDEMKMRILKEMLIASVTKRNVDSNFLEFQNIEKAGGAMLKMEINVKEGINKENAKKIVSVIKDLKLKVQPSIMDDKIRVQGKKIDYLQETIKALKNIDLKLPLQFINMKN